MPRISKQSKPEPDKLASLNREIAAISIQMEDGSMDWEHTLEARAALAKERFDGDEELTAGFRFSWITGMVEKRLI